MADREKKRARDRRAQSQCQKRRRDILNAVKVEIGCKRCGYNEHPAALHFHHVRGPKLFNIGRSMGYSAAVMEAEIAKCDVLCADCHHAEHRNG
jgi:hypothetical protein